ncbi:MAG: hypothetical protein HC905_11960 [Bacteroidales bacterium]|nr:hypothetical protein [Bacteroidales bacterium]
MKNNKPSAIEILLDYPREKGLPFETHESEQRFISAPGENHKNQQNSFPI